MTTHSTGPLAIFVPRSKNPKTGDVAATYASIDGTCPPTCKLRKKGCYAKLGKVGMINARLSRGVTRRQSRLAARQEARAIRAHIAKCEGKVKPGLPLRLHVSGDCSTNEAARIVGGACTAWVAAGGGRVWAYTHAWELVERASWGPDVNVLASVDSPSDAAQARARGYVVASYTDSFASRKVTYSAEFGSKILPCPAQDPTKDVTCTKCGMCLNEDRLRKLDLTVLFEAHGPQARAIREDIQAKRHLTVVAAHDPQARAKRHLSVISPITTHKRAQSATLQ